MECLVIGFALAFSSTFLVKPAQERVSKHTIIYTSLVVMVICGFGFAFSPSGVLSYVPVFFFYFFFGVSYPTMLGLFSSSVSEADQGWVMGVTTAVFCLAGGVMSLIGGGLMSVDIRMPYYIVIVTAVLGLIGMHMRWKGKEIKALLA